MDKELFMAVMTCDGVKDMIFQRSRAAMRWRAVNQAIDVGGESFAQRLRGIPLTLDPRSRCTTRRGNIGIAATRIAAGTGGLATGDTVVQQQKQQH